MAQTLHTQTAAFRHLPITLKRFIEQEQNLREFAPGRNIISEDENDRVCFIVSGQASLVLHDDENRRMAVETLVAGDIFGEIEYFTGIPWPAGTELIADEKCTILKLPINDFEQILREDAGFATHLLKNVVRKNIVLHRKLLKAKLKRRALQQAINPDDYAAPNHIIGDHVRKRLAGRIGKLAESDCPVLIIGETGVGKEVVAATIFDQSHRGKDVFLQFDLFRQKPEDSQASDEKDDIDVAKALTDFQLQLLFGVEADKEAGIERRQGFFEMAEGGTLLIRHIERLTPAAQLKLLEAMVTDTYRRKGGTRLQHVQVRVIATTRVYPSDTTMELHPLVHALLEHSITIPPLRVRRNEIPGLIAHYLDKFGSELHLPIEPLSEEIVTSLTNYNWPGNDVELASTLKRAILASVGGVIRPRDMYLDLKRVENTGKFNLLRFKFVKNAITSPLFPAILQSAATPFLFIMLIILFLGPGDPAKNPAALFGWAVSWPGLVISSFLFARFWCSICPIGTIGNLAKSVFSLERPFPRFLKNRGDLLVAAVVLFIIWIETVTSMREHPAYLGILLAVMIFSTIVVAVIYERNSWCMYLCGLGSIAGIFAKTSLIEMRADREICISRCYSNECYTGSSGEQGCPFGTAATRQHTNRLCIMCGRCVKNCPHDAVSLNLRFPGREIWELRHVSYGLAFLVVGMIGGLIGEMTVKSPLYRNLTLFDIGPTARFSVFFFGSVIGANLVFLLASAISKRFYGERLVESYTRFGMGFLPLALMSFMAFHVYYLITLGVQLPTLLSHNFDISIFKTLIIIVPPYVTKTIQFTLVFLGMLWSMVTLYKISSKGLNSRSKAIKAYVPYFFCSILYVAAMIHTMSAFFYN